MKYLIPMALALLVLTGCGDGENNGRVNPFIGGNIGINAYFGQGAPPGVVFDGGKFPFGVNVVVENNGEADIGPGTENPYMTVRLEGINPNLFGVTDAILTQTLTTPLPGAEKLFDGNIIGGQVASFVFENLNWQGKLQGNDVFTLRATMCYDYSNIASSQICFKDSIVENVQDSTICTLTGDRLVANSGGPLHVTKITQNPMGDNKILVNIILEHVGPGEFFGRSAQENCNPSATNSNKFKADVEVTVKDTTAQVQCYRFSNTNHGTLTLFGGAPQTVTCTVTGGTTSQRIYTDILYVKTKYRYGQFIEQPIEIQAVPQEST